MTSEAPNAQGQPRDPANNYDIREIIGKGAFGDVYLVVHRVTKKKYVLKRIKLARQNEWQRSATRQEIQLVSSLRHPFIIPYIEHWVHHGHTINIIYGYCEKGDFQSQLQKQKGKLYDEEQLKIWLSELILAVEYMHRMRVLHRDLKTQNLLLTSDNDLQIGDFGLATFRSEDKEAKHDQALVGTPHYMSPELLSQKKYGFEIDLWSLGCIAYEWSSLRPPFDAFNLTGLVTKIRRGPTPPLPPQYSQEWGRVVKSLLRKEPEKRPSVYELLALPYLQDALALAKERGRAILPDFEYPEVLSPTGASINAASTITRAPFLSSSQIPADDTTPYSKSGSDQHSKHLAAAAAEDKAGGMTTPTGKMFPSGVAEVAAPAEPVDEEMTSATKTEETPRAGFWRQKLHSTPALEFGGFASEYAATKSAAAGDAATAASCRDAPSNDVPTPPAVPGSKPLSGRPPQDPPSHNDIVMKDAEKTKLWRNSSEAGDGDMVRPGHARTSSYGSTSFVSSKMDLDMGPDDMEMEDRAGEGVGIATAAPSEQLSPLFTSLAMATNPLATSQAGGQIENPLYNELDLDDEADQLLEARQASRRPSSSSGLLEAGSAAIRSSLAEDGGPGKGRAGSVGDEHSSASGSTTGRSGGGGADAGGGGGGTGGGGGGNSNNTTHVTGHLNGKPPVGRTQTTHGLVRSFSRKPALPAAARGVAASNPSAHPSNNNKDGNNGSSSSSSRGRSFGSFNRSPSPGYTRDDDAPSNMRHLPNNVVQSATSQTERNHSHPDSVVAAAATSTSQVRNSSVDRPRSASESSSSQTRRLSSTGTGTGAASGPRTGRTSADPRLQNVSMDSSKQSDFEEKPRDASRGADATAHRPVVGRGGPTARSTGSTVAAAVGRTAPLRSSQSGTSVRAPSPSTVAAPGTGMAARRQTAANADSTARPSWRTLGKTAAATAVALRPSASSANGAGLKDFETGERPVSLKPAAQIPGQGALALVTEAPAGADSASGSAVPAGRDVDFGEFPATQFHSLHVSVPLPASADDAGATALGSASSTGGTPSDSQPTSAPALSPRHLPPKWPVPAGVPRLLLGTRCPADAAEIGATVNAPFPIETSAASPRPTSIAGEEAVAAGAAVPLSPPGGSVAARPLPLLPASPISSGPTPRSAAGRATSNAVENVNSPQGRFTDARSAVRASVVNEAKGFLSTYAPEVLTGSAPSTPRGPVTKAKATDDSPNSSDMSVPSGRYSYGSTSPRSTDKSSASALSTPSPPAQTPKLVRQQLDFGRLDSSLDPAADAGVADAGGMEASTRSPGATIFDNELFLNAAGGTPAKAAPTTPAAAARKTEPQQPRTSAVEAALSLLSPSTSSQGADNTLYSPARESANAAAQVRSTLALGSAPGGQGQTPASLLVAGARVEDSLSSAAATNQKSGAAGASGVLSRSASSHQQKKAPSPEDGGTREYALPMSSPERQRLELLEHVIHIAGHLYRSGKWEELGKVLELPSSSGNGGTSSAETSSSLAILYGSLFSSSPSSATSGNNNNAGVVASKTAAPSPTRSLRASPRTSLKREGVHLTPREKEAAAKGAPSGTGTGRTFTGVASAVGTPTATFSSSAHASSLLAPAQQQQKPSALSLPTALPVPHLEEPQACLTPQVSRFAPLNNPVSLSQLAARRDPARVDPQSWRHGPVSASLDDSRVKAAFVDMMHLDTVIDSPGRLAGAALSAAGTPPGAVHRMSALRASTPALGIGIGASVVSPEDKWRQRQLVLQEAAKYVTGLTAKYGAED